MNPLDPWRAVEQWLNHGEGAQLTDEELAERMRYPDRLRELIEKLNGPPAAHRAVPAAG